MGKTIDWVEKAVKLAIALIVLVFIFYIFKSWAYPNEIYFSFTGKMEEWAILIIMGFAASKIIGWLWKLEVHEILDPKKPRRRKR